VTDNSLSEVLDPQGNVLEKSFSENKLTLVASVTYSAKGTDFLL